MRITFPDQAERRRALTILEMLVSTALLSFIVLGLTAMFVETQRAFKLGIKQANITDAGRSIIDMMAADFSQLSDPGFTNYSFPPSSYVTLSDTQGKFYGQNPPGPSLYWALVPGLQFNQTIYDNGVTSQRTNQAEDIFAMIKTNGTWLGVGYTISNWFTNSLTGQTMPGVGTLYRYVITTNAPLCTNNFLFSTYNYSVQAGTFTNAFFHRIADGVVHLKIYAYDADGNEMTLGPNYDNGISSYPVGSLTNLQYPYIENVTNVGTTVRATSPNGDYVLKTNLLPHSIDIELGILEPEALEHARSMFAAGAMAAAGTYLTNAAGQVEIFRQHIIIPAAP